MSKLWEQICVIEFIVLGHDYIYNVFIYSELSVNMKMYACENEITINLHWF